MQQRLAYLEGNIPLAIAYLRTFCLIGALGVLEEVSTSETLGNEKGWTYHRRHIHELRETNRYYGGQNQSGREETAEQGIVDEGIWNWFI